MSSFPVFIITIVIVSALNAMGNNKDLFSVLSKGMKTPQNNKKVVGDEPKDIRRSNLRNFKVEMDDRSENQSRDTSEKTVRNSQLKKVTMNSQNTKQKAKGQKLKIDVDVKKKQPVAGKAKNKNLGKIQNTKASEQEKRKKLFNPDHKINRQHIGNKNIVFNKNNVVEEPENVSHQNKTAETEEFEIIWELGPAKHSLAAEGREEDYELLADVVKRANTWLKKYLKVRKGESKLIQPYHNEYCGCKVKNGQKYSGHMLIVVKMQPNDEDGSKIIASGRKCTSSKENKQNQGELLISSETFYENMNPFTRSLRVVTIIHEVLHAIVFNFDTQEEMFTGKYSKVDKSHKNLLMVKESNARVFEEGHWVEAYILNDFMMPKERNDFIFSIFTLELVEHLDKSFVGNRKILPNNFLWDHIKDHKDFFAHKCGLKDDTAKYPFFCGLKDKNKVRCSKDYKHKTTCREPDEKSNCRLRVPFSNGNCLVQQGDKLLSYHYYGPDSRCFETFMGDEQKSAVCMKYEYRLSSDGQSVLYIGDGSMFLPCNYDGEILVFKRKDADGKIKGARVQCPNLLNFKHVTDLTDCPFNCHNNGVCVNKKCVCMGDYDEATNCETLKKVTDVKFVMSANLKDYE